MNQDREIMNEAMDEAQDEILRLTEALAVEKGAHVETAKALVACRKALMKAWITLLDCATIHGDENGAQTTARIINRVLQSTDAGDDYVSKASVKPIVEALKKSENAIQHVAGINDENRLGWALRDVDAALDQAKLLGLV